MSNRGKHPNSRANLLTPFGKGREPKVQNGGRKPDRLKKFIEDNGLSSDDIAAAVKYLFPLTLGEIRELMADESQPMLMRLFARFVVDDMKSGRMENLNKLFDRAIGKPTQKVDADVSEHVYIVSNGPEDEL
jgi:hypothetical protein